VCEHDWFDGCDPYLCLSIVGGVLGSILLLVIL
jgi:hypothetical protein